MDDDTDSLEANDKRILFEYIKNVINGVPDSLISESFNLPDGTTVTPMRFGTGDMRSCNDPNCIPCRLKKAMFKNINDRLNTGFKAEAVDDRQHTMTSEEIKAEKEHSELVKQEIDLRAYLTEYLIYSNETKWDDVVGNEVARAALIDAVEHPRTHAALYAQYGRKAPRGVLLYGPPGCGKTMLARATASAVAKLYDEDEDVPAMLVINGPELESPYVSVADTRIRNIFNYAKIYKQLYGQPLVIFIDEADTVLRVREGGNRPPNAWEESRVATFLTELDGMDECSAFVILATNRMHTLDAAVMRDGRCDRKIKVERPKQIHFNIMVARALAGVPINKGCTIDQLVNKASEEFYSPAHRFLKIMHAKGPDYFLLSDMVSGAMVNGLIERAKERAFNRDMITNTVSGIEELDIVGSVREMAREYQNNIPTDAVQEVIERIGCKDATVEAIKDSDNPLRVV